MILYSKDKSTFQEVDKIYLEEGLENGNVSIDDLINLVAYVKQQGWIQ